MAGFLGAKSLIRFSENSILKARSGEDWPRFSGQEKEHKIMEVRLTGLYHGVPRKPLVPNQLQSATKETWVVIYPHVEFGDRSNL